MSVLTLRSTSDDAAIARNSGSRSRLLIRVCVRDGWSREGALVAAANERRVKCSGTLDRESFNSSHASKLAGHAAYSTEVPQRAAHLISLEFQISMRVYELRRTMREQEECSGWIDNLWLDRI